MATEPLIGDSSFTDMCANVIRSLKFMSHFCRLVPLSSLPAHCYHNVAKCFQEIRVKYALLVDEIERLTGSCFIHVYLRKD